MVQSDCKGDTGKLVVKVLSYLFARKWKDKLLFIKWWFRIDHDYVKTLCQI